MKFLWILMFVSIFSCVQAGEIKPSTTEKSILLEEVEVTIDKPDTFLRVEDKTLKQNVDEVALDASSDVAAKSESTAKIVVSDNKSAKTESKATDEEKPIPSSEFDANAVIEKHVDTKPKVSAVETSATTSTVDEKPSPALIQTEVKAPTPVVEEVVENKAVEVAETEILGKPDHSTFNTLLTNYVANGKVNYKGFKGEQSKLQAYISDLTSNAPADDWNRNEKLAYWMNLYNAATINLILDNYPVASIMDLDGGKPWDVKRVTIDGQQYSLNDIEHTIIRPRFKDARIHFAVNCAAKSCPPISSTAFTGDNVNAELDRITKKFINSSANKISANSISISKIFEWYAEDFGDIVEYINSFSSTKVSAGANVNYIDYDWSLNGN
jgi:hypothetical protein